MPAPPLRARAFLPSPRSVAMGLAIAAAAAGLYGAARSTSAFAVRGVTVRGASPTVAAQVRRALRPFEGESLLALDGAAVVRRAEALPWVASASYDRAFPHEIVVTVVPERPAAVVRHGADAALVAAGGRVLERLGRGNRPPLPRVWAREGLPEPGAQVREPSVLAGLRAVDVAAPYLEGLRVRTVLTGEQGLVFVLASGLELRFGDPAALRVKAAIAAQVAERIVTTGVRADYVDVTLPERPVAGTNPQVEGSA